MAVHGQLAVLTSTPEMALDPKEAQMLAKAASDVAKHYPQATLSPKTAAWFALTQCALMIYAPRIVAVAKRRTKKRASPSRATAETTTLDTDAATLAAMADGELGNA